MYYLLLIVLVAIVFYAVTHVVSSILKGCMVAVFVAIIGLLVFFFIKSTKEPVSIFGYYQIDNFEITRIEK